MESNKQGKCTQKVKEEREMYTIQKISVRRKLRARCSEMDEWLGKNCKDMYRIVYMTEKRKKVYTKYRTEAICCPGESGTLCHKDKGQSQHLNDISSPSTIRIVTIVVPTVLCLMLFIMAIAAILCYVKKRKQSHVKQHNYIHVTGDGTKCLSSPNDVTNGKIEHSVDEKLIPLSVEVVDSNNRQTSLTSDLRQSIDSRGCRPYRDADPHCVSDTSCDLLKPVSDSTGLTDDSQVRLLEFVLQNTGSSSVPATAPSVQTVET